ncbi:MULTISPECIES: DUF2188 domain-containing protein [Vibrio harveyi group]|uniref:DUF2188 domain-containing protein n=1 Tax=Vibrio harveyi group TaxID=717610 RepID=UPI0003A38731|nr:MULTISPECIES: DUF2188 domain-containing protein [Vibrio harveyi group]MCR9538442.1 DUF2188 domain-containing protein [Vibrio alginolyticus]PIB15869.1 hypothetical protein B853_13980 [Vibrio rotiferianus CAIM 577 = LMG 21460]
MGKNQWVVKKDGQWGVKGEGNEKMTSYHKTQKEAIEAGKAIAQNQKSELIIQGKDNKIREKNSYGNDDFPPKG